MDYQAGKPADPRVVEAMLPYLTERFGNPSSLHSIGQDARKALDESRGKVAELVGAKKNEIIFTSGGTESNNLAIRGVALRNRDEGKHLMASSIEHMSVINTCKSLEKEGFKVTYLPVDSYGSVDVERLRKEVSDETVLISVMYANGEIGTIQPIREIGEIAQENDVYLHVDAVAAVGQVPIDVEKEHVDLLSISSNDIYGPKGFGALYIKQGTKIMPTTYGGGQERGLRPGSENVPSAVGMAKAAEIAMSEMKMESERLTRLRDRLIKGVLGSIPNSYLNGHPENRLPNNVNLRFSYIEGESLLLSLDMEGVSASSGSACVSMTLEPSHVLRALGLPHEEAHGSLLFSLGKQNSEEDVDHVLKVLPSIVEKLREISPLTPKHV